MVQNLKLVTFKWLDSYFRKSFGFYSSTNQIQTDKRHSKNSTSHLEYLSLHFKRDFLLQGKYYD
ncbi:MAG: hypothetical protein DRI75_13230 [Bacteroidetes bacterium]|nr:MAG: hypothetical protein DRI75_13230 [Bacteroidota bacterium]